MLTSEQPSRAVPTTNYIMIKPKHRETLVTDLMFGKATKLYVKSRMKKLLRS